MMRILRPLSVTLTALALGTSVLAQQPPTPPTTQPAKPPVQPLPAPNAVAATVNGQPIFEVAVQRGLKRVPPARQAEARPEIVNYLIDNVLIDQHLQQLNIAIDKKDIDARMEQVKKEIEQIIKGRTGVTFESFLKELMLTEAELREINLADMRWDRYSKQQATEQALKDFFEKNKEMFDGTMVRARHILLTPPSNDQKACDEARAQLAGMKKSIEAKVAEGLAKLPANTDALAKEQARTKLVEEAFAATAREKSVCPSNKQGGDVDWFPRAGSMVEPFAAAAFGLKQFQMSDVVQTQFGYHLILATDRRPGKETKFEDVKDDVREVFSDRLREGLCGKLRPAAKIAIVPVKN